MNGLQMVCVSQRELENLLSSRCHFKKISNFKGKLESHVVRKEARNLGFHLSNAY
jgi:hypothetical protein